MRCARGVCMVGERDRARWLIFLALGLALAGGCRDRPQPSGSEIVMLKVEQLPASPEDPAWQKAPEHVARLLLQDIVEPRQLKVTTAELRVRALQDGKKVAFRLQWKDPTKDELPGPGKFLDGCALQVPAEAGASLPAPQMGEPGRAVEILFWSAGWQAMAEGRADRLQALYPNAWVDHYPYEAPALRGNPSSQREMENLYLPARALGNHRAGPRSSAVEEYLAQGPGTLTPRKNSGSHGMGKHNPEGWSVLLTRSLPRSRYVALAVWDGAEGEAGGRKMRTSWIALRETQPPPR